MFACKAPVRRSRTCVLPNLVALLLAMVVAFPASAQTDAGSGFFSPGDQVIYVVNFARLTPRMVQRED